MGIIVMLLEIQTCSTLQNSNVMSGSQVTGPNPCHLAMGSGPALVSGQMSNAFQASNIYYWSHTHKIGINRKVLASRNISKGKICRFGEKNIPIRSFASLGSQVLNLGPELPSEAKERICLLFLRKSIPNLSQCYRCIVWTLLDTVQCHLCTKLLERWVWEGHGVVPVIGTWPGMAMWVEIQCFSGLKYLLLVPHT